MRQFHATTTPPSINVVSVKASSAAAVTNEWWMRVTFIVVIYGRQRQTIRDLNRNPWENCHEREWTRLWPQIAFIPSMSLLLLLLQWNLPNLNYSKNDELNKSFIYNKMASGAFSNASATLSSISTRKNYIRDIFQKKKYVKIVVEQV
jgi:hypothetical protein